MRSLAVGPRQLRVDSPRSAARSRGNRGIAPSWPFGRIPESDARVIEFVGPVWRKWTSELRVSMKPDQPGGKSMTIPSHRASAKEGHPLRGVPCSLAVASIVWVLAAGVAIAGVGPQPSSDPSKPVDFAAEVQPILARACLKCHGPEKPRGGLRLDSRRGDDGRRLRRSGGQAWRYPGQHPPGTHRLRRPGCEDAAPG